MRSAMGYAFALLLWSTALGAEERPAFRVIVHAKNPLSSLERRFLAEVFLKKQTQWPNGVVIRPVELERETPARQKFCQEILGKSIFAVQSYWQQAIFSGRDVPPPEMNSDEDVIRYVQKNEGAIGYVSAKADLGAAGATIKVLTLQ